jgi:cytochrome d ubiquinol oxidase subunit I
VSPSLTGGDVAISFALYIIVYLVMYPTGIAFMAGLVRRGPAAPEEPVPEIESGRPGRPFERASMPARD